MPLIAIPDDAPAVMTPSTPFAAFRAQYPDVAVYDTLPGADLAARCRDAEIVVNIRSSSQFTDAVLSQCPRLRLISIWGTGTDNVDLAAATRRGITVTNTPAVAAPSIAEHTLALLLAAARRIPQIDSQVRKGEWPRGGMVQLTGKTCGVIGLGAIGLRFARLAAGIGMRVVCWTMHPRDLGFPLLPLDHVLAQSDVVSLHLRLTPETRGFIGARQFELMKPGAILINTARGPIVDEPAMLAALSSGKLRAAGLDVFDNEPLPERHPLTMLDNVALTPHCAGITPEALEAGLAMALANVTHFLAGHPQHTVGLTPPA